MVRDPVPAIREQWRRCRPDLDTGPMEIAGRILLAASLLQARLAPVFREHGITSGSFDVLATLRRQGPPFELTPTELYRELLITSGTLTHRLDVLEGDGLVERHAHPTDRRGALIRLTKAGRALADEVVDAQMENERRLFQSIPPGEARALAGALGAWIESLDEE